MVEDARENLQAEEQTPPVSAADQTAEAGAGSEAAVEKELTDLRAQLAEAEKKTAEYLDGWQRSQAAFANFRKRSEAEQANWRIMANAALLSRILPVLDDFRRAFDSLPAEFADHAWMNGIVLIRRKLQGILDAEQVKPIELKPGDLFDPMIHQAVLYQAVEGFGEGQVVAEIETGYILGERVLRPAMVVVAKAPAPASANTDPEPSAGSTATEDTLA
jgi:molecular chaperone GrpE